MQSKPSRVLVVDDNVDAADLLAEMLRLYGYDTAVAYDGKQGIEVAIAFSPDIAVLDLNMPELDGFEVAVTLRRDEVTCNTVLIAYSASNDRATLDKVKSSGFDFQLTKPSAPAHVAEVIATALRAK